MPLSGCKEVLEPYLMKNEIVVNKVMESESISSALALTLQVKGITIGPIIRDFINKLFTNFIVQPIEIKIPRQSLLCNGNYLEILLDWFWCLLRIY